VNANWQLRATIYDSSHFTKAWKAKKEYTPETATAELHITIRSAIRRSVDIAGVNRLPFIIKREVSQCKHTVLNVVPREK